MTRRPGISLTEILVALFIMALGTIAILTMFPMGLITMGQALKDDRATQCAHQADAYMRWYWKERGTTEPFYTAMNTPGGDLATIPTNDTGPSYPVYVDPMGTVIGKTFPNWMGDGGAGNSTDQTNIPRRSLTLITSAPLALRTCSLLDTLGYDESGNPLPNADMRTLPYNWAWLLQRPNNSEQSTVDVKVIVYDKRVHQFEPSASEKVFIPTAAAVGQTVVSFNAAAAPPVQKGGWLLDVSVTNVDTNAHYVPATAGNPAGKQPGVRNANFYRVVSVTQNGTTVNIELQTPLKDLSVGPAVPAGFNYAVHGRFMVLNGIYEVFELPQLTSSGP